MPPKRTDNSNATGKGKKRTSAKPAVRSEMKPSTPSAPASFTPTVPGGDMLAIVGGYHGAPHTVLGPHVVERDGETFVSIRVFRPLDARVIVNELGAGKRAEIQRTEMQQVDPNGFFEALFPDRTQPFPYRIIVVSPNGDEIELEDPYRFPFLLSEFDHHLFAEGNFFGCYEKLGAHFRTVENVRGVNFAVWAPNALRVGLSGPFNGWDHRAHPMTRRGAGIWELFVPNLVEGEHYKYAIKSLVNDYQVDKADPFAFFAEMRPSTDSRVWDVDKYAWSDDAWMEARAERQTLDDPIAIYEVHLGSWKRVPEDNGFLSYRDLAHQLVEHVTTLGYTHIELLPITEHPFDGSWGYQVTGYYAPTSRFGTPDDFKYFVDYCHQHNIGVILDWVPAHFPKDAHGLAFFDGTHLYEHEDPRRGEHRDWGTKIFNYGRNEVRNFLLGNALFWVDKYHLDGFRVDAVASMLYLDFGREAGDWLPNRYGGRENLEAIDFIRRFNELVHEQAPGVLTIAEESTSWPMVSRPTYAGGLGFSLKWNMGWMHDMLSYMKKDPVFRRYHQGQITFSLMYAFSENFVLPFSHDEVVHLKKAMLDKMPGDLWQKFANLRALYGYMYGHPGKKLLFMGGEFGQWREWSEARSLDWHLLDVPMHKQLMEYVSALNHLYASEAALHEVDTSWEGFQWIDLSDVDNSVISFIRRARNRADHLVMICNLTPNPRLGYRVGLPELVTYTELLNSDNPRFGGSGVLNTNPIAAEQYAWQACNNSAPVNLPPLGIVVLKPIPTES